jgi:hypothetical protein
VDFSKVFITGNEYVFCLNTENINKIENEAIYKEKGSLFSKGNYYEYLNMVILVQEFACIIEIIQFNKIKLEFLLIYNE